ncbi:MAG: TCR/Tet family MFS transporter [Luteibaculum sp.]
MKNHKAALGFIFVTLLLDITGIGIIIPVIPSLIIELTGSNLSHASEIGGWLLFAYAICQFAFAPIIGGLSDQLGRKPVLIASLIGFAIDYVFMALAPTLFWLFIGRIVAGIFGASFTTCSAYIADVSPPEKRAQNFGLIGAAFGLGFIIGPVLGGVLGEFGPRIPFYAAAALTGLNVIYGFLVLPESLAPEKRRKFNIKRANPLGSLIQLKKYPILSGLVFAMFFVYIASHAVQSTWSFFTMFKFGWTESMVGYSLGFVGILSALVQGLLIRWLIPKIGQINAIYVGLMLYVGGLILFSVASSGWMMFAFLIPYCLGGICGPALQGLMSSQVPDNEQGELQGALTSMMSVTAIVGPPLMTFIFATYTNDSNDFPVFAGAPMLAGAIFCFVGLFFSYRTLRVIPKKTKD